ncbi:MAG: methionine biosynthesis protein MetW [Candidatus Korobacteraceae bacterium]
MGKNPTVEEVMQRIRARVAERNSGDAQTSRTASFAQSGASGAPTIASAGEVSASVNLPSIDFSGLHSEIEIALEGTRRVGQLNPRNPGVLNAIIQFVKKVMRRSLTWYTRPIHYFQGGVIRALQQTEGILRDNQSSMQLLAVGLNRQSEVSNSAASESQLLRRELAEANSKVASLERTQQELSERLDSTGRESVQLREVLSSEQGKLAANLIARIALLHDDHLERMVSAADELARLQSSLTSVSDKMRQLQLQGRMRDRDIRRFMHELHSGQITVQERETTATVPPMFPVGIQRERDFDYFAFEDIYRGDEDAIRQRQKAYLEYFRGRQNVLDVGCGRGEFLELLRDNHISAKGVELGTDQYLLCHEKGLDVVRQDLFAYLESLPNESLGGLFSAQVIEHLTASDQLRYVALAHQKTMPGSPVIFETINAQCVWAVMRNFFLDPTHVRPVHPETLKFAMESVKFKDVEIRFSSPMSDRLIPALQGEGIVTNLAEFNRRIQDLNELLYGNQDYAAIGWK